MPTSGFCLPLRGAALRSSPWRGPRASAKRKGLPAPRVTTRAWATSRSGDEARAARADPAEASTRGVGLDQQAEALQRVPHAVSISVFPARLTGTGRMRVYPLGWGVGAGEGRRPRGPFSGNKRSVPPGRRRVPMATQRLAAAPESRLQEAALPMELFAVAAAAASLFLLVFVSVYVGSGPPHQSPSQNC